MKLTGQTSHHERKTKGREREMKSRGPPTSTRYLFSFWVFTKQQEKNFRSKYQPGISLLLTFTRAGTKILNTEKALLR